MTIELHKKDPLLTSKEMYLFNRGEFYHSFLKFGAHRIKNQERWGTFFALWAPYATKVSVVGDFNGWCGVSHPMEKCGVHGIWTLFIPGLEEGEIYKYEILTDAEERVLKADPFAFFSEVRPDTASVVYSLEGYPWHDQTWLNKRKTIDYKIMPLAIYEIHLGSWKSKEGGGFYSYREIAPELISYLKKWAIPMWKFCPCRSIPMTGHGVTREQDTIPVPAVMVLPMI